MAPASASLLLGSHATAYSRRCQEDAVMKQTSEAECERLAEQAREALTGVGEYTRNFNALHLIREGTRVYVAPDEDATETEVRPLGL